MSGHVLVVGNEKGGAGKSTVAVHLAVALSRAGLSVAALDIDLRQRSFTRYFENRARWAAARGVSLPGPSIEVIISSARPDREGAADEDRARVVGMINRLRDTFDVVVVDAPGSDTTPSRAAHGAADTLITPLNDSFLDFDLLAEVDPISDAITRPSLYAEMVWEARKAKSQAEKRPIDWIVLRNRLSTLDARNKRRVGDALAALAGRVGFRIAPGLSERVIYREMFPSGLTLLDMNDAPENPLTMSQVAARQELRELVAALKLPCMEGRSF